MKPEEIEKALKRIESKVEGLESRLMMELTILTTKHDAIMDELADALGRQKIDPEPFRKRVKARSVDATKKILRQKEKIRDVIRKHKQDT